MSVPMLVIWIAATVGLVFIEAMTSQMVTIWFAVGSLAALLSLLSGADVWLQCVIFTVVSLAALAVTRPLAKRITGRRAQPTNADRIIGESAVVTEDIDNTAGRGLVRVSGADWTARSADGSEIPRGTSVTVDRIEGVKVIVSVRQ